MHLILTGATGLVGSGVLRAMLLDPAVTRVSILSRRPVPQAEGHEKAEVIIHKDFATYPAADPSSASSKPASVEPPTAEPAGSDLRSKLASASGVVWALGISQNAVSASEYEKITHDYALAFVRFWAGLPFPTSPPTPTSAAAQLQKPHRNFIYVSGDGTTHSPGLLTTRFATVKGRTEMELLEMTVPSSASTPASAKPKASSTPAHAYFPNLTVFAPRPAGVDSTDQPEIHPYLQPQDMFTRAMWVFIRALRPAMIRFWPNTLSPTKELGEVLTELAKGTHAVEDVAYVEERKGKGEGWRGGVVANRELRKLAGLRYT